jgi:glc operon protein GlcG
MPTAPTLRLTNAGARSMMQAAIAEAASFNIAATVAIVDAGGHIMLLERMDGGRFHTVHSSTTKAATAASNRRPTTTKGAQGQDLDTLHALGLSLAAGPERWTAMAGGYPIFVDGHCIGGIGVSGGDWQQDAAISEAALQAIDATPSEG